MLTLAVNVPLPEPEPGVTDNQEALSLAVQLRVPPAFVRLRVWFVGFAAPCVAMYDKLEGLRLIVGAVATVKVMGTVTGVAPVALTVTVPL